MQRIISLVPSQTELLYDLELEEELIGITKFCVYPEKWFRTKTRIGSTKNINIEKILSLNPDLVIANKEENVKEQIEVLRKFTRVYVSDVANLVDAKNMILHVGDLVGRQLQASSLVSAIESKFSKLETISHDKIPAAYFIWRDPYMAAGGDTFINDMMKHCGFKNIFEDRLRYPEINIEEIKALACKVLLLSSEPFPFKQKQVYELQPILSETKILLVNGEMFSWYGSRLLYAPDYFMQLNKILTS